MTDDRMTMNDAATCLLGSAGEGVAISEVESAALVEQVGASAVDVAPFRSAAQLRASRENGKKSHGPKTEAGKANSRKNALKHGLSSQNPAILPPNLQLEVAAEVELFTRDLKPQNHVELRLVETAALATVRFLRLSHAEVNMAQERARAAVPNWRNARQAQVCALAKQLDAARLGATAEALAALKRTSHGCMLLSKRYGQLARAARELSRDDAGRGGFARAQEPVAEPVCAVESDRAGDCERDRAERIWTGPGGV